jgi:ADP-ribose pyrophosphatase YjhB (NUDIX family)
MAQPVTPRFCASCGGALLAAKGLNPGGAPYLCSQCGLPVYEDPKVAAAVVVRTNQGVLLLRRAQRDRAYGKWILPGGHVDRGEVVLEAARREVLEETGLMVEITGLLGVYSYKDYPWVLVVYTAEADGGRLCASPEALEIKAFAPEEMPWDELGYESTAQAMRDYLALLA